MNESLLRCKIGLTSRELISSFPLVATLHYFCQEETRCEYMPFMLHKFWLEDICMHHSIYTVISYDTVIMTHQIFCDGGVNVNRSMPTRECEYSYFTLFLTGSQLPTKLNKHRYLYDIIRLGSKWEFVRYRVRHLTRCMSQVYQYIAGISCD